tara:strand:+ start:292 stop:684 length:393 start_codon:yes stop_codon:yes gene_type:complete
MTNYTEVQLKGTELDTYIAARFSKPVNSAGVVKTLNVHDFRQEFIDYNRGEQFTDDALTALFEWLIELVEDTGEPYDLDVIALCCEFTEYVDLAEIQANYSCTQLDTIDDLQGHTTVIEFNGGIIIQDFC